MAVLLIASCQCLQAQVSREQKAIPNARLIPPGYHMQNHIAPPVTIYYNWDTLSNVWNYNYTGYKTYNPNLLVTSSLSYDTIANEPISRDTTVYDSLGRQLLYEAHSWNGSSWVNNSKLTYAYWDTSEVNYSRYHYLGSGNSWNIFFSDSFFCTTDQHGNILEKYNYQLDTNSWIFKPMAYQQTGYDSTDRVIIQKSYLYDTTSAQYENYNMDSNIVYDAQFTDQRSFYITYLYNGSTPYQHFKRTRTYSGPSRWDYVQEDQFYQGWSQSWENSNRQTLSGQGCDLPDSSISEVWNNMTWKISSGGRNIFHYVDSCDYDEWIMQVYPLHLQTFRNAAKLVYPMQSVTGTIETNKEPAIIISPNPFHDKANISIRPGIDTGNKKFLLKIFNALGVVVREEMISPASGLLRRNLDAGLYFYELTRERVMLGTGKFVIE